MDFHKTATAFGATACLLMGVTAFAAVLENNNFESTAGTWDGDKSLSQGVTVGVPSPAGLPITTTPENPNVSQVLDISGSASNVYNNAEAKDTLIDMMVKVSIPDEALSALDAAGAKFAVAVDRTTVNDAVKGVFKYWDPTANSSEGGWVQLSETTYDADAWVRVTMKFYYSAGKCVVALNGDPCNGEYSLLNSPTTLASIEVKGSTSIDEVFVTQDTMVANFADSTEKQGDTVTKAWLTANNVPWSTDLTATTGDGSGYSLTQKYKFGLEPADGKKFELSFKQDDSQYVTLSFPGFGAYGGTGSYVLQTKSGNDWITAPTTVNCGFQADLSGADNIFSVALPTTPGTAVQYRVFASSASGN